MNEQWTKLRELLERHRSEERTDRCLAALLDETVIVGVEGTRVPSQNTYDIYLRRSMPDGPAYPIQGYTILLPALEEKARLGGNVRIWLLTIESEWFSVFTDEEAETLYGILSEKSDGLFRYFQRLRADTSWEASPLPA